MTRKRIIIKVQFFTSEKNESNKNVLMLTQAGVMLTGWELTRYYHVFPDNIPVISELSHHWSVRINDNEWYRPGRTHVCGVCVCVCQHLMTATLLGFAYTFIITFLKWTNVNTFQSRKCIVLRYSLYHQDDVFENMHVRSQRYASAAAAAAAAGGSDWRHVAARRPPWARP